MEKTVFFLEHTKILEDINLMWDKVYGNLETSLTALKKTDAQLTYQTIKNEKTINKLHVEIENETIDVVATKQPVASNLRMLISIFKISKSLERIGDYAVHIAKEGRRLAETKYPGDISILESMVDISLEMLKDAKKAFNEQDSDSAREIAGRDDLVDAKHKEFISDILINITKDPENADMYTRLVSTVNSVERICDHITDICESIVYLSENRYVDLNEK